MDKIRKDRGDIMAELQYVVNVKCINTKLAEVITGELGDLIIVNIPNSIFTPYEFDKLIDATGIIKDQASKNRANKHKEITSTEETNQEKDNIGIIEKRKLWEINVLQSGELILINMPSSENKGSCNTIAIRVRRITVVKSAHARPLRAGRVRGPAQERKVRGGGCLARAADKGRGSEGCDRHK
jgi:hypothetical protein